MKFKNVEVSGPITPGIIKTFENFFTKDTISIGAISRKMPFILMALTSYTKMNWSVDVRLLGKEYDSSSYIVFNIYTQYEREITITVKITFGNEGPILRKIWSILRKDKFVPTESDYSVIDLMKNDGKIFTYRRRRQEPHSESKIIFRYDVEYRKFSMLQWIKNLFSSSEDTVVDSKVINLEARLQENIHV